MSKLNNQYWNNRWINQETGWDIGYPSPAIINYFKKVRDKKARILIPGCGNAYEAQSLLDMDFTNITLLDFASNALEMASNRLKNALVKPRMECIDFFEHQGQYDYIVEQTFFCALDPALRTSYVDHIHSLLSKNGMLVGLLFNIEKQDGPPFGGCRELYKSLFENKFQLRSLELCTESIKPRAGNEFFIEFIKKG